MDLWKENDQMQPLCTYVHLLLQYGHHLNLTFSLSQNAMRMLLAKTGEELALGTYPVCGIDYDYKNTDFRHDSLTKHVGAPRLVFGYIAYAQMLLL
jgi:hypothetical protein